MAVNDYISTSTLQLARFIRDVMPYDEQLIKPGQQNFEREDFNEDYIVPDEISSSPVTLPKGFDPVLEEMDYCAVMQSQNTVDFFGKLAFTNAVRFIALIGSQQGYELQRDMGISVFSPSTITDLTQLTGQQYSPRFQIALNVRYNESVKVPTLRIDEAVLDDVLFDP